MTTNSLPTAGQIEIEQFMIAVGRAQKCALLLDYDGTLAPFSPDRRRAFPYEGVPELLQEIMLGGRTRIAIITGRNAFEVSTLLRTQPVPEIWGSHGLQRLRAEGTCEMPHLDAATLQGLSEAGEWLAEHGLQDLTEYKPGSVAIHWRGLRESSARKLREEAVQAWSPIAERVQLSLLEFDGGLEIRIPKPDKGDAVRTILQEMGPGIPIAYLGDDVTDEHAFDALGSRGMSILVRPERRETRAQFWLKPPGDVLDFLEQWRQACM
jgi:trehalose 6-phosphate phosphatase